MSDNQPNIILTGFMGTGKTTIGRLLAARLGRRFVDMDEEIEARAGMTVREIFAAQGENAFRQRERNLARELSEEQGLIIATGGGTLVDTVNRRMMESSGLIICLTTAPEILLERLKEDMTRPLLHAANPANRLQELLASRAEAYASLPHHLDTTDLSPEAVVDRICTLWQDASQSV